MTCSYTSKTMLNGLFLPDLSLSLSFSLKTVAFSSRAQVVFWNKWWFNFRAKTYVFKWARLSPSIRGILRELLVWFQTGTLLLPLPLPLVSFGAELQKRVSQWYIWERSSKQAIREGESIAFKCNWIITISGHHQIGQRFARTKWSPRNDKPK